MINKMVAEIRQALANKLYLIALNSAITLPDICGRAEYPNGGNGFRYKNWVKKYVESRKFGVCWEFCFDKIDTELLYSLRCSLSHQGTPNVEKKIADYFELIKAPIDGGHIVPYTSEIEYQTVEGIEKIVNKKISVNISILCNLLCVSAEEYYEANKEKFDFINYHLVDVDFRTSRIFNIKQNLEE